MIAKNTADRGRPTYPWTARQHRQEARKNVRKAGRDIRG